MTGQTDRQTDKADHLQTLAYKTPHLHPYDTTEIQDVNSPSYYNPYNFKYVGFLSFVNINFAVT